MMHAHVPSSCKFRPFSVALRLGTQMEEVLKKMQGEYDKLTSILSEATVHPDSIEKFFDGKW